MFWTDETVEEILKRNDEKYLVTDYKTPSGKIHVGALRGVMIHDVITRGLKEKKKDAEFWYGFDDFDAIDGLSDDLKADFEKHMGEPLCNVASPEPGQNFAQYFANPFVEVLKSLGVSAKIVWASELYRAGRYNKAIEIALNNASKIREIYKEVSGGEKPNDWYPLQVVCPKCGKLGTTKVYDWDGSEVSFECKEDLVDWAKGCGYKGKISPFDGAAKMPYKVETAAKWFSFGTSVELAGKDHYTKGGAFFVAKAIAEEVFKIKPAYGYGYEWFLVGGKKMSTSKGVGVSTESIAELLPTNLLRFLMVRTKAKRAIEFNPEGDTIPLLYDEYDRCAKDFQGKNETDMARAFFYTEIDLAKDLPTYYLRFSKVANFLQMPRMDIFAYAAEEKSSDLTEVEKAEIENRIEVAKKWLANYAPDSVKFEVQETLPEIAKSLSDEQRTYLNKISDAISAQEKWTGEDLHAKIHEIKNEMQIAPKDAFSAIYLSFLGKDSGPQAGWLLASLDQKFVIDRLKEV